MFAPIGHHNWPEIISAIQHAAYDTFHKEFKDRQQAEPLLKALFKPNAYDDFQGDDRTISDDEMEEIWERWPDLDAYSSWSAQIESVGMVNAGKNAYNALNAFTSWAVSIFLLSYDFYIFSPSGILARAPNELFLHKCRLDLTRWSWPFENNEIWNAYQPIHDSIDEEFAPFCFLNTLSGSISIEADTYKNIERILDCRPEDALATISTVKRYKGWSICCREEDINLDVASIQNWLQKFIDEFDMEKFMMEAGTTSHPSYDTRNQSSRSVGRPPLTPVIESTYDYLFPDGHEKYGHSWKEVTQQMSNHVGRKLKLDTISRRINERKNSKIGKDK